ncbi:MAG: isocitrate/isopropylmalate family dehydrogenase [Pseudomonadota bacterium]
MTVLRVAVFEGDGIGPEVMAPTLRLLESAVEGRGLSFDWQILPAGAEHYRQTGQSLPATSLASARAADAILLSAMGLPEMRYPDGTEISPQIELRKALGLFAGLRPVVDLGVDGPLGAAGRGLDFVILRESTEGLFASHGRGTVETGEARETLRITRRTSEKLFDFAFNLAACRRAEGAGPGRVTCVDKANVFRAFAFFRSIFEERATHHPGIETQATYVDAAALQMVTQPHTFDVLVTENMFGDILSDLGAGLVGGLGVAPSADIGDEHALFQPCHGSAPDIAGQGVANPIAMILSGAMMLDWLGHQRRFEPAREASRAIRAAVTSVVSTGRALTPDLGGRSSTTAMADAIVAAMQERRDPPAPPPVSHPAPDPAPRTSARAPLRVAQIGAGFFARLHAEAWRALPGASLVGLADREPGKAAALLAEIGADEPIATSTDLGDLIASTAPEIVDIVTPPNTHLALIEAALAAPSVRAVVCQKPFCADLEAAQRATAAAARAGKHLIVHENFRFQPWYRAMKSALDAGDLGTPLELSFRLRPGDGQGPNAYLDRQPYFQQMPRFLVHETAVHWIDTFTYLFGPPDRVFADLRRLNPAIAGEDAGKILFAYPGGLRAFFDGNRLADHAARNRRFTMGEALLEGTQATLSLDGDGVLKRRAFGETVGRILPEPSGPHRLHPTPLGDAFGGGCVAALQAHVLDGVQGTGSIENDAASYCTICMIERAVYDSSIRGEWVMPTGSEGLATSLREETCP